MFVCALLPCKKFVANFVQGLDKSTLIAAAVAAVACCMWHVAAAKTDTSVTSAQAPPQSIWPKRKCCDAIQTNCLITKILLGSSAKSTSNANLQAESECQCECECECESLIQISMKNCMPNVVAAVVVVVADAVVAVAMLLL